MRNLTKTTLIFPLLLAFSLYSGLTQADTVHPQQVIQNVTDQLLILLEGKKQKGDIEIDKPVFFAELETILDSAVDYEKFSKGVMGKYYRKSTALQHQQFIEVFKKSLFAAYGNAFLALDNEKIIIQNYTKTLRTKATIKMDVHTPSGKIYPIAYSMHLTKEEQWKLKNVIVNGLNLGLTFKNQFLSLMSKHRDVDKVIQHWSSDVADDPS